jgi:ATP-dependent DNA helicase RecQ
LLKDEGVAYLTQLMRELQEGGMLISSGGDYPMVTLTKLGEEVMKGQTDYKLRWPSRGMDGGDRSSSRKPRLRVAEEADVSIPVDTVIYERLKTLRLDLARKNGDLPAYMIFPDETLRAFARLKPKSIEAGRKIRGVGEIKAKRYLPAFIEAIVASN